MMPLDINLRDEYKSCSCEKHPKYVQISLIISIAVTHRKLFHKINQILIQQFYRFVKDNVSLQLYYQMSNLTTKLSKKVYILIRVKKIGNV